MATALARRLSKIEAAIASRAANAAPHVLCVGMSETRAEAVCRFNAAYPGARGRLIVPAKPVTEAEHADFAARFKANQDRIVREARSRSQEIAAPALAPAELHGRQIRQRRSKTCPWRPTTN